MSSCIFALNDFAVTARCIAVHFTGGIAKKVCTAGKGQNAVIAPFSGKPLPYIEQNFYFVQSSVYFYQGAPCRGTDRGLRRRCVSALLLICIFDSQFLVKCFFAFCCFIIQHFALPRFCLACAAGSRRCYDQSRL